MNILHLSDTPLSGSPLRIAKCLNKHTDHDVRHMVWKHKHGYRDYGYDINGYTHSRDRINHLIYDWADIIHYHNRWRRQKVFEDLNKEPPKKPSVIQIHSPRASENFIQEIESGIPIATLAQYHARQWPEKKYIVPNVIDITDEIYKNPKRKPARYMLLPVVSYAPSNTNGRGWDDKSYGTVSPVLKRMSIRGEIHYQLIHQDPFDEMMDRKSIADIGIEEVTTGSYHLSSLEYLAFGIPCICYLDSQTEKVVKDLTGATTLPWIHAREDSFERAVKDLIKDKSYEDLGIESRVWMEIYFNPKVLCDHYLKMYEDLV